MDNDLTEIETLLLWAERMLCPPGEPHTGTNNRTDHGHTTCWVIGGLLDEVDRLRDQNNELTAWIDNLTQRQNKFHTAVAKIPCSCITHTIEEPVRCQRCIALFDDSSGS